MSVDQPPSADPRVTGLRPPAGAVPGARAGQRRSSFLLIRVTVGALAIVLLIGSVAHLAPAVRAGLRDGTRGYWVAVARTCTRKVCAWTGKFVLPGGHGRLTSAHYAGQLPAGIHAGTKIPALFTGSGLVFPVTGSDLWISLVVTIAVALLALYWATHRWVAGYFRQRAASATLAPPLG